MFETGVAVVGTVLTEPRTREVSGSKVVSFRVGSSARRFDKTTEQWVDGDRLVATVNCWRRVADGVDGVVAKSAPVVVSGRLRTREYELHGQWRTSVEIEANAVGLDLARSNRFPEPEAAPAAVGGTGGSRGFDAGKVTAARPG
ncbi:MULTISPECIES: single-stranded DNA-binding protein [unclassified Saccharopolyspora]|uniref:single-stranded DNA-binding protein n=1 Tax=Saccharopolyspora TaxID=1835 RepID=UPI00190A08E2|nr:single-stranded DNA-binding protein [Saccharopolyspora sp. HNM0986]MBK0868162.1 single-stranded DNA-binding protein [Saccharopolyspora sp. HNM0986]